MIAANDQIEAAHAYDDVVIAYRDGAPVKLRNIATVIEGLENQKVGGWYQGEPAVVIDIQRQPGANVIDTVQRIKRELPRLQRAMPAAAKLTIVSDRTETIRASVRDVQLTLILAVALVVTVVLIFLRTIRATIIAGVALPLSIVATFGVMWFCGFSLDNLSLMALTIGTGFVVDDAIVMIENIVRHLEAGRRSAQRRSARRARDRVHGDLADGLVNRRVHPIAVHDRHCRAHVPRVRLDADDRGRRVGYRVADLDADDVQPLAAPHRAACGQPAHACIHRPDRWHGRTLPVSLQWVLRHQFATLVVTFATLAATIWLYIVIPKGFLPPQDTGLITAVTEAGQEISFSEMQKLQAKVVDAIRQDPDVTSVVSIAGVTTLNATPNAGRLTIALKPRDGASHSSPR